MKSNAIKGLVFSAIRTVMEFIDVIIMIFALQLNNEVLTPVVLVLSAIIYIVFAIVPHFFVKKTLFWVNTLANFIAQVLFALGTLLLLMILIMFDTSDAAGWLLFVWMGGVVILCPIYFVVNIIVDLIAFLITRNKKGGVRQ